MSPEQAAGELESLGTRSDVYSLGATLYCLLTGRPPVEGDDIGSVLRAAQRGEFPPPHQLDPTIDQALEAVCLKAMAREPADRFATPQALAEDVERWMADEPVSAGREPFTTRVARWTRRHRALMVGVTALVATTAVSLAIGTVLLARAHTRTEEQRNLVQRQLVRALAAEEAAQNSAREARMSASKAEAIKDFLVNRLLAQVAPEQPAPVAGHRRAVAGLLRPRDRPRVRRAAGGRVLLIRLYKALGRSEQVEQRRARWLDLVFPPDPFAP
jgi:eukaryotic-like serine/threonine-protein kinase